ncbi:unnamed protein product [Bursaphelenchus xylophilus]|uniref:(pine wood nematode) hypothetical protein n=1 Tax=Bursaphelenchus xylophilus TaxID=6326 RepID=A0A1I7STF3_BURXY|nr:unnamed protein product [Bursaphelenchus xylophilus]CAG9108477.1 unnamed protein product [Bursaphelenchus xylophilus]
MADINVFNTFSFKKWSERLREQKIEEEIQRQRIEQVARLRDKLARERSIREMADMLNEDDVEKLIDFLNEKMKANKPAPNNSVFSTGGVFTTTLLNIPNAVPVNNTRITVKAKEKPSKRPDRKLSFNYNRKWEEMARKGKEKSKIRPQNQDFKIYDFNYNRRYGDIV